MIQEELALGIGDECITSFGSLCHGLLQYISAAFLERSSVRIADIADDLGNFSLLGSPRKDHERVMLYIDLDDFDHINDAIGHQNGDLLLKSVAEALNHIEGVSGHCYRIGGDEFVVLVSNRNFGRLESIIDSIKNVFSKPWYLGGKDYYCTMSMGVVIMPKDGVTVDTLMQRADIALHWAKNQGKNRVEYYNSNQASNTSERLDLERAMRSAVEEGCKEFEVYYQPLMDITNDGERCCGAEALLRWNSKTLGMVMPDKFIPLAEYLGLINDIGAHVLHEAASRCKYWNDFGHPEYKVNVNLSVVQLVQTDIVDVVKKTLEDTNIKPSNLTLEVTESLAVNDMDKMQQVLGEIKALGVHVALDDFGTGYSSLNHIRSIPYRHVGVSGEAHRESIDWCTSGLRGLR